MKICSSNGCYIYEFGSAWIKHSSNYATIYVRDFGTSLGAPVGEYCNVARAKGVLFDMMHAYKNKESIFYMPKE